VIKTDRERTLRVFAKRMRLDDPEILNETYDYYALRFSFPPRVNMEGIKDTLDFYAERNAEVRGRKPEEFVDHSVLDELEKAGFVSPPVARGRNGQVLVQPRKPFV